MATMKISNVAAGRMHFEVPGKHAFAPIDSGETIVLSDDDRRRTFDVIVQRGSTYDTRVILSAVPMDSCVRLSLNESQWWKQ